MPAISGWDLPSVKRAAISHQLRIATDEGQQPLLSTYDLEGFESNARLPSPAIQAMNFIRLIGDRVLSTGKPVPEVPIDVHALIGSPNREFAMRLVKELFDRGLLHGIPCGTLDDPHDMMELDLTLTGWEQFEAEQRGKLSGKYGFIALKFGDSILDPFLQDVIKPAVASIGYFLEDMRDAARAGVIDNVMRAKIRDSAFVLVDLSHANAGAYWEAGYAEGLGKPVLYLCNRQVFEEQGTHFDTNHCTTVLWDAASSAPFTEELKATLRRSLGLFIA